MREEREASPLWMISSWFFTTPDSLQGKAHHKNTAGDLPTSNGYFGTFTVENSSLQVKEIYTTEVGTPSGSRYDEYLAALDEALTYKIENDRLTIFYGDNGQKVLHFKAGEENKF